ncbi:MAG: hypothetical protein II530_03270 [Bacteroidaceae bacterium]|nr:hypothetical protein [Bacteroidaceae bacterium]
MKLIPENNNGITLASIQQRKLAIKRQLNQRKGNMVNKTQSLFTPTHDVTKWDRTLNLINNSIAVYDGLLLGLRLMMRFKGFFRRR